MDEITIMELPKEMVREIVSHVPLDKLPMVSLLSRYFRHLALSRTPKIHSLDGYVRAICRNDILCLLLHRGRHWYSQGIEEALCKGHEQIVDMLIQRYNPFIVTNGFLSNDIERFIYHSCRTGYMSLLTKYAPVNTWSADLIITAIEGVLVGNHLELLDELLALPRKGPIDKRLLSRLAVSVASINDPQMIDKMSTIVIADSHAVALAAIAKGNWDYYQSVLQTLPIAERTLCIDEASKRIIEIGNLDLLKLQEQHYHVNLRIMLRYAIFYRHLHIVDYICKSIPQHININKILKWDLMVTSFPIIKLLIENSQQPMTPIILDKLLKIAYIRNNRGPIAYFEGLLMLRIKY